MLFWIIAALLTLLACLAILLPLTRARPAASGDASHDVEVYRDQLAELDRDLARGTIGATEAGEARAEIARRLLRAETERTAESTGKASRAGRAIATVAVLAVPVVAWSVYATTGSPQLPSQPLQTRLDKSPADSSIDELVARAERHLANNPSDGRGWDVLAPIYVRMGRHADAATAYRNAMRLLGATAAREIGLGDALAAAQGGLVTTEAHAAYQRALVLEPDNPKAHFMLALALAQEGKNEEATAAWRALSKSVPEGSPWRGAIAEALAGLEAAPEAGPTDGDVEAAALMSEEERTQMIDGMVAGLDARLREDPRDAEGWRRLVQSYVVLGRTDEAADALARGVAALGEGSDAAEQLVAFAAERGVEVKEQATP